MSLLTRNVLNYMTGIFSTPTFIDKSHQRLPRDHSSLFPSLYAHMTINFLLIPYRQHRPTMSCPCPNQSNQRLWLQHLRRANPDNDTQPWLWHRYNINHHHILFPIHHCARLPRDPRGHFRHRLIL